MLGGAKKGQILKTFCYYNAQNLEKFEKNQLPFLVFWKIKVFKANFSNFLLKYRESLKNSSLKPSKFQKKSTSDSGFLKNSKEIGHVWEFFWKIDKKKVKFSELFGKILR